MGSEGGMSTRFRSGAKMRRRSTRLLRYDFSDQHLELCNVSLKERKH